MRTCSSINRTIAALVCAIGLAGCGSREPEWRTYDEIVLDPPGHPAAHGGGMTAPHPTETVRWTVPAGWIEEAGTGMRLATLTVERDGDQGVCTLIVLGQQAGVLDANVRRWIGQLGFDDPDPQELAVFLERQERLRSEGGLTVTVVNVMEWGDPPADAESILAAMIPLPDATLFLRLTGPARLLTAVRAEFVTLCKSVRIE